MPKDYNGWANRSTWLVALWLDNDPYTYGEARTLALATDNPHDAGDAVKCFVEGMQEEMVKPAFGLFTDLVTQAMCEVDWLKIGKHYREE